MKLREIAQEIGFSLTGLEYAATRLSIDCCADINQEEWERITKFLKHHGGYTSKGLELLSQFEVPVKTKVKVKFLGGGKGFSPNFLLQRREHTKVLLLRQTRNCGDTAALIAKNLTGVTAVIKAVEKNDFIKSLLVPAKKHEVWQATIHQHTFTLERNPKIGNRLVQSYQASVGTYNVQYWCGLADSFISQGAIADCGNLKEDWFEPSDEQLAKLASLIEKFYEAEKKDRCKIWKSLPFHPGDVGRLLKTNLLAFDAEQTLLSNSGFPQVIIALQKSLE